ncbi:MAG: tRNA lysidine(34) synthetase TilS [Pelagibacteraceae bacterium]
MTKKTTLVHHIKNYLSLHFSKKSKILISLSGGVDSTTLYYLIVNSKFFKNKNIHIIIFDHQIRREGRFEIRQLVKEYNLSRHSLIIKKLKLTNSQSGFQNKSRLLRYKFLIQYSKKNKINDLFLGHHLDDLNETFLMRKVHQSNVKGLSSIFTEKFKNLIYHRPLRDFSKASIIKFATQNGIKWYEDRTNAELDYSRNKIRSFLNNKKINKKITQERLRYKDLANINNLYSNYFKRITNKDYLINYQNFSQLNKTLQEHIVKSFFLSIQGNLKNHKSMRENNVKAIIKFINRSNKIRKNSDVFGGFITFYDKKMNLKLT